MLILGIGMGCKLSLRDVVVMKINPGDFPSRMGGAQERSNYIYTHIQGVGTQELAYEPGRPK